MISKITIKNVRSYKEETYLETDKKINLVYGLNGSGKTTISDYLYSLKDELNEDEFQHCEIEGFTPNTQKILVYNQKFVTDNFYENDAQKGIFTLAKENKEALENIKKAKAEKENLSEELGNETTGIEKSIKDLDQKIANNSLEAQGKTWEIKTEYTGGDRVFDTAGFLDKLKFKKNLFEHIFATPLQDTTKNIEGIKKEVQEFGENETQRDKLQPLVLNNFSEIESNSIFQEEIIGSQNSSVAALIEKLGNSDWVQQGLLYIKEDEETCPFCQQDTLDTELKQQIKNYFDETYKSKINELEKLKGDYQHSINPADYEKDFFDTAKIAEITTLLAGLSKAITNNLSQIQNKIKSPSQKVTLQSTTEQIGKINTFISERNKEIEAFNHKIRNREETIKKLKDDFWQVLRKEYDNTISDYQKNEKKLKSEQKNIEDEKKNLEGKIEEQANIIRKNLKETINVEATIEAINKHLLDFGIQDFEIIKHEEEEDSYRIKRSHEQDESIFKSLSEGEKTVISFLYFVELCKGKEDSTDTKDKIIVIDDPISSLSHMYLFNVAQLIKTYFTNPKQTNFLQCFVLTHSLYFFHELVDKKDIRKEKSEDKVQKFFRIEKHDTSKIEEMKPNAIQNDYDVYWSIVKTASQENMPLVANAMRNIIEYFFGFIERKNNFSEVFNNQELKGNKFQAFKRYMDRESHSDPTNISDYKEFNLEIFTEAFQAVFKLSGYEEHYKKYMGGR